MVNRQALHRTASQRSAGRRRCAGRAVLGAAAIAVAAAYGAAASLALVTAAAAQTRSGPGIVVSQMILIEPGVSSPLAIVVAGGEALPRNSYLRIKGLPAGVQLTEGHRISAGTWAVPLASLTELKLLAEAGASGRTEITLTVVALDGREHATARASLVVATADRIAAPAQPAQPERAPQPAAPAAGSRPADKPQAPAQSGPLTAAAALAAPIEVPSPNPAPRSGDRPAAGVQPAAPAVLSAADRGRAERYFERGNEHRAIGGISQARLFYERAAQIGLGKAAFALAETFDPIALARSNAVGIASDPAEARRWYERAQALGVPEAAERIQRLAGR